MRLDRFFFLALAFLLSVPADARATRFATTVGAKNRICRDASAIMRKIPTEDFMSGRWRSRFKGTDWFLGSKDTPLLDAYGGMTPRFSRVDIYNNGAKHFVVMQTGSFRGIDFDHLYIPDDKPFDEALKKNTVEALDYYQFPTLNPGNSVKFGDGKSYVPIQMHVWNHRNKNYLIMKEHYFLTGRKSHVSSLILAAAQSGKIEIEERSGSKRMVPKLLCIFK